MRLCVSCVMSCRVVSCRVVSLCLLIVQLAWRMRVAVLCCFSFSLSFLWLRRPVIKFVLPPRWAKLLRRVKRRSTMPMSPRQMTVLLLQVLAAKVDAQSMASGPGQGQGPGQGSARGATDSTMPIADYLCNYMLLKFGNTKLLKGRLAGYAVCDATSAPLLCCGKASPPRATDKNTVL